MNGLNRNEFMKNILILFAMLATSCAHLGPKYHVDVESWSDGSQSGNRVLVASAAKTSQLEKNHYEDYLRAALYSKGYVPCEGPKKCDLVVMVNYGIDSESVIRSAPIMGYNPGKTSTFSGTSSHYGTNGYSGTSNTYGAVTTPGNFYVAGSQTYSEKEYTRMVVVEAFDFNKVSNSSPEESGKLDPAWKMIITSLGSSGDLRNVYPVLLTAGLDYFGKDSGGKERKYVHSVSKEIEATLIKLKSEPRGLAGDVSP
jgi:hypothetical protein